MTFAEEIKAERERIGYNIDQAASVLGISSRTLWSWENGDIPSEHKRRGVMAIYASVVDQPLPKLP